MSILHTLPSIVDKSAKRVGRGYGSGKGGHTASFGQKGQRARRGVTIPLRFEGGNLPLIKRLPMLRGKSKLSPLRQRVELTLRDLDRLNLETISIESLKLANIVPAGAKVKIIATGKVTKPVNIQGVPISAAAKAQVIAQGGTVA